MVIEVNHVGVVGLFDVGVKQETNYIAWFYYIEQFRGFWGDSYVYFGGGVYKIWGVYKRGASNKNFTLQGRSLLDTRHFFESGHLLDHLW